MFYLAARLGVDAHTRLEYVDAVHVYVGLVGGVFVAAKVARVRFRYRVAGVPEVIPWQRWISWSLLILYSAVWISGVLLLTPLHGRLYNDLINFHLISSVWAVPPTTWHVWHYRRRAAPYLTRVLPRGRTLRYWAGIGLVLIAAAIVVLNPRSLSQLPQVMGGSTWTASALQGSYLDRVATGSDGLLVATGDALYVSHDGTVWTQIDIPGVPLPPSATPSPAAHQHGAPTGKNLGLSLAINGDAIFVGTDSGLYRSIVGSGTLQEIGLANITVYSLAIDPERPSSMWAGTSAGLLHSTDGGSGWVNAGGDLPPSPPLAVTAVLVSNGRVFAADATGVFESDSPSGGWRRTTTLPDVIDLSANSSGSQVYAASGTGGVQIYEDGSWRSTDSLQSPHQHHAGNEVHPEVLSVAAVDGRLYAAGTAFGVSASADGGATWTQLGGGLSTVSSAEVADYDGALLVATSGGIYEFELEQGRPPSARWWWALAVVVLAFGAPAVVLVGFDRLPRPARKSNK